MKPGYRTTEFWLNVGQQIVALLVLFGVIQPQNAQVVQEQVARDILAVCTLAVSAAAVIHYVQGRIHLKSQAPSSSSGSFRAGVVVLAALGLAGPALAAPPPATGLKACCPCGADCRYGPACRCIVAEPVALFPWRSTIEQRLQRLEAQPSPGAGPAQPPVTIHQHFYGTTPGAPPAVSPQVSPYQQLPIAGQPQQQLPIAGAPKQPLPIAGTPQQNLPVPGTPQQPLPIPGPPQQPLPIGAPTPPQQLPAQPMPHLSGPTQYTRYALYRRS